MADREDPAQNRPAEDEEDEEEDVASYRTIKDAVLFAIDVSSSMLQRPPPSTDKKADRDSPTSAALKCAYQLMQQRIISNPNDMMGILLFGIDKTDINGDTTFPHCYLLADLNVPSADDVKRLRDLVEDDDEAAKLLKPSAEGASIATVLFCANQIFTTNAPNFSSRRLFLVTDNDNPAKVKQDKDTAITRARDLYDLGCTIDLFPISRDDHGFDRSKFYDDLVYPISPSQPDAAVASTAATAVVKSGDGISLLQSLISSINSKATPKRALFSLPLELGPDLRIGVKGFILIKRQEAAKRCYVWVGGEKLQIAHASTTQTADDTARVVEKAEVRKAYKFGGETITFTPEEITQIRQCFGDPVIRIIGFKPISMLPLWANTKNSTFIYPSEADYVGSTRVFAALQQKLLKSKKMGLAWFIARRNAGPVITAVIPSEEKYDENGEQTAPPGLWLIPLPFSDDVRKPPEAVDPLVTTDDLTDSMRAVVEQLQLPKGIYDPRKYPNPDLQWFYRILQAMALEEEVPEKPDDKTVPKYKQIDKRAGYLLEQFGKVFQEVHENQRSKIVPSAAPKKRGATGGTTQSLAKRPKNEPASQANGGDGLTDAEMVKLRDKGALSKQTVATLKDFLKARGQNTTGKKADLADATEAYLEEKGL